MTAAAADRFQREPAAVRTLRQPVRGDGEREGLRGSVSARGAGRGQREGAGARGAAPERRGAARDVLPTGIEELGQR